MHSLERGFHIARWTACVIGCRGYVPQREREREKERNHIDPESHTRLDVGESIKISHRELSAERENISNIQPLRFSHPLLILAFIISARETFFIDWTRPLNFLSLCLPPTLVLFLLLLLWIQRVWIRKEGMFSRCLLSFSLFFLEERKISNLLLISFYSFYSFRVYILLFGVLLEKIICHFINKILAFFWIMNYNNFNYHIWFY